MPGAAAQGLRKCAMSGSTAHPRRPQAPGKRGLLRRTGTPASQPQHKRALRGVLAGRTPGPGCRAPPRRTAPARTAGCRTCLRARAQPHARACAPARVQLWLPPIRHGMRWLPAARALTQPCNTVRLALNSTRPKFNAKRRERASRALAVRHRALLGRHGLHRAAVDDAQEQDAEVERAHDVGHRLQRPPARPGAPLARRPLHRTVAAAACGGMMQRPAHAPSPRAASLFTTSLQLCLPSAFAATTATAVRRRDGRATTATRRSHVRTHRHQHCKSAPQGHSALE